jgi:hypothetical protein
MVEENSCTGEWEIEGVSSRSRKCGWVALSATREYVLAFLYLCSYPRLRGNVQGSGERYLERSGFKVVTMLDGRYRVRVILWVTRRLMHEERSQNIQIRTRGHTPKKLHHTHPSCNPPHSRVIYALGALKTSPLLLLCASLVMPNRVWFVHIRYQ